jgi:hypothetical protein
MRVKIFTLLALFFVSIAGFCQNFQGIVRDSKTQEVMPYANIGIRGKQIGSISDQQGFFTVDLANAKPEDILVISYVGYTSKEFQISKLDLNKQYIVELTPSAQLLNEVVVRSKKDLVVLGNKGKSSRHTGWGDFTSSRGRAIGLLIPAYEVSIRVNSLFFHLNACEFDSVLVRINFFSQRGEQLIPLASQRKNIFQIIKQRKGWVEVRIVDYIVLDNTKAIVAIEWLDAWAKPRSMEEGGSYVFTISMDKTSGYHYQRQTSEEPVQLHRTEFTPSIYLACTPISAR